MWTRQGICALGARSDLRPKREITELDGCAGLKGRRERRGEKRFADAEGDVGGIV